MASLQIYTPHHQWNRSMVVYLSIYKHCLFCYVTEAKNFLKLSSTSDRKSYLNCLHQVWRARCSLDRSPRVRAARLNRWQRPVCFPDCIASRDVLLAPSRSAATHRPGLSDDPCGPPQVLGPAHSLTIHKRTCLNAHLQEFLGASKEWEKGRKENGAGTSREWNRVIFHGYFTPRNMKYAIKATVNNFGLSRAWIRNVKLLL